MGLTGIRLRAYPTSEQARKLSQWIGCARFIYNAKCDDDKYFRMFLYKNLSLTGETIPLDKTYAQYKTELTPWLDDCPSVILRNSVTRWYEAYQRYFQGLAGRPKHKKKGDHGSIWLTNEVFHFDDGKLFIGGKTNNIGYLSFEAHKEFTLPKSITLSRSNGEWFVSFCYQDNLETPQDPIEILTELSAQDEEGLAEVVTGLDRGVVIPLQASDGKDFDFTPQQKASIKRKQKRIKKQSRRLARQQKGSRRRYQTKHKIAKAHNDIANLRKDFAHKTSRTLVDGDSTVFIAEDLRLINMTAKPKAKQDENGRYLPNRAKAKAGLNAALLNSAIGSMILFLAYKAHKSNKVVIKLPAHYSSQECVKCNHTHPDNRQTQAKFVCLNCGHTENADLQAAKVMRKRGIKAILSATKQDWKVNSDHTLTLVAKSPAGTRGSARGGKAKTQRPQANAQSLGNANLVVVVPVATNPGSLGL